MANDPVTFMTKVPKGKRLGNRADMAVATTKRSSAPTPPPANTQRYFANLGLLKLKKPLPFGRSYQTQKTETVMVSVHHPDLNFSHEI
jgi:hypothetical protein